MDPNKKHALILGFLWVFCGGILRFPVNLQATVVFSLTLLILWKRLKFRAEKNRFDFLSVIAGIILCFFFSLTTNRWLLLALYGSILFILSSLALKRFSKKPVTGLFEYISEMFRLIAYSAVRVFSIDSLSSFFLFRTPVESKVGSVQAIPANVMALERKRAIVTILLSIFAAIFLFLFFHVLFSRVNEEYESSMNHFLEWSWTFLLKNTFFALLQSYLISGVLGAGRSESEDEKIRRNLPMVSAKMALLAIIFATSVFSGFQTKLVVVDAPELKFPELSKYAQKGFLELLIVITVGYFIALFALRSKEKLDDRSFLMRALLSIFIFEMGLIALFCAHKIFLLQWLFGLKDQRILADSGILFVLLSLVLLAFRIPGSGFLYDLSRVRGFQIQTSFLIALTLVLNFANVDAIVTEIYPIHYYRQNRVIPDYSYLLGNSYDNVSAWTSLMREMRQAKPEKPAPGYFWGYESGSGVDYFGGSYTPICSFDPIRSDLHGGKPAADAPTRLLFFAFQKYNGRFDFSRLRMRDFSLEQMLDFNAREYAAYRIMQQQKAQVDAFHTFLLEYCKEESRP